MDYANPTSLIGTSLLKSSSPNQMNEVDLQKMSVE